MATQKPVGIVSISARPTPTRATDPITTWPTITAVRVRNTLLRRPIEDPPTIWARAKTAAAIPER